MKNDFDNSIFSRITELISLLSREDMSVAQIAQITATTPEQTRLDLAQLHHCGIRLLPEEIVSAFDRDTSRYDNELLSLDTTIPTEQEYSEGLLFLEPHERNLFLGKGIQDLAVKDIPSSVSLEVLERAEKTEEAIKNGQHIQFRYKKPGASRSEDVEIAPRFLLYNATDSFYYCIAFRDDKIDAFRLDRMLHNVRIIKKPAPPVDPQDSRLQRMPYYWGADFSPDGSDTVTHIRIRISANTSNVLNKIRSDISRRAFASLYEDKDSGYWYYEDDVIGLSSFRAWLRLFGSSVKVIEPAALAEEAYTSSHQRLQNYEQDTLSSSAFSVPSFCDTRI